ncbi:Hypothetical protein PBC10988_32760 [Planctomycetales bacterium 10988]|nr:Hypothetical protein PBC10988_32760 [Planctomycetales bacterium 10988]
MSVVSTKSHADVFISYAVKDRDPVIALAQGLKKAGFSVWRDGDQLLCGDYYGEQIAQAIHHSKVVVLMLSPNSLASDNVMQEVRLVWDFGHRKILPIWLTEPGPMPERFRFCLAGTQYLSLFNNTVESILKQLVDSMRNLEVKPRIQAGSSYRLEVSEPAISPKPVTAYASFSFQEASTQDWESDLDEIDSPAFAQKIQKKFAQKSRLPLSWQNAWGMEFRLIPPGIGKLGTSPEDTDAAKSEFPEQLVPITTGFWMGTFPITGEVVQQFLQSNHRERRFERLRGDRTFARTLRSQPQARELPVTEINAEDAAILCQWLCEKDNKRYRIPTEAEWEYAARAGASGAFWWESSSERPPAAFAAKSPAPPDPTRSNAWGLMDMSGNVEEWTCSPFEKNTILDKVEEIERAVVAPSKIRTRVVRGGSWQSSQLSHLRLPRRRSMFWQKRAPDLGIRLVCMLD